MTEVLTKADLYYALTVAAKARQDAYRESQKIAQDAYEKYEDDETRMEAASKIHSSIMLAKAARCEGEAMLALYNKCNTRLTEQSV